MGRLISRNGSYNPQQWLELAELADFRAHNLAKQLGISQRQLERYIKRHFESSPQQWLKQLRMEKARELVKTMNSVKEIAYSLGFKQVSHFCREFKLFHGVTCTQLAIALAGERARSDCELIENQKVAVSRLEWRLATEPGVVKRQQMSG